MPLKFWDEAFLTVVFLTHVSPIAKLFDTKPAYSFLRTFGCACWPNLRCYNTNKLAFCSKQCTFLGYSTHHKGYKCLDISSGCVYISCDVVFDENVFFLSPCYMPMPVLIFALKFPCFLLPTLTLHHLGVGLWTLINCLSLLILLCSNVLCRELQGRHIP
jgi:hypothetical protein